MKVLFVHQNFPGQYRHIAPEMARRGHEVVALGMRQSAHLAGVRYVRYASDPKFTQQSHYLVRDFSAKVARGMSAGLAALQLRKEGFYPDVILGHHGWGETLFLKDVWSKTKLLSYCEFFYSARGADVDFDPEFSLAGENPTWQIGIKNAPQLLAMQSADWLISPTKWQAAQVPIEYQGRLSVIHDGIDTRAVRPDDSAFIKLGRNNLILRPGSKLITFVNRNLEPYRGYHKMMRALPSILKRCPDARIVLVGGSSVSYGSPPPKGKNYKQIFFEEVMKDLDLSRVHFVGNIPYADYIRLLQVSMVHVYLTYPFVLSWSLLEAMAAGCCIVASATPPVAEVLRTGENSILIDFHSVAGLADAIVNVLRKPHEYSGLRQNARKSSLDYDLATVCLPHQLHLIDCIVKGVDITPGPYKEMSNYFPARKASEFTRGNGEDSMSGQYLSK